MAVDTTDYETAKAAYESIRTNDFITGWPVESLYPGVNK
jgi:hypothetical protein